MTIQLFCQQVKFNRALGLNGDLYVGTKPVMRAVVVVKSEQESSFMVQQGRPYVAFMTADAAFHGDAFQYDHFFATAEEAIAFAKHAVETHPAIVR
jgi:hypothetical protein